MSNVTRIIDSPINKARLMNELAGKGPNTIIETLIRATRDPIAKEALSIKASDAVKASVTPQIKKLAPDILEAVKE